MKELTPGKDIEDARDWVRAPVEAMVSLQLDAFDDMIHGFSANISAGGMFISNRSPVPVGSLLRFKILLEGDAEPIAGIGEVVWIRLRQGGPDQPQGMGIRFVSVRDSDREKINQAVHSRLS